MWDWQHWLRVVLKTYEMLVVSENHEVTAREVLIKFLDCQCLLVDLCVIPLCGGQCSGCKADGSLSAIRLYGESSTTQDIR